MKQRCEVHWNISYKQTALFGGKIVSAYRSLPSSMQTGIMNFGLIPRCSVPNGLLAGFRSDMMPY